VDVLYQAKGVRIDRSVHSSGVVNSRLTYFSTSQLLVGVASACLGDYLCFAAESSLSFQVLRATLNELSRVYAEPECVKGDIIYMSEKKRKHEEGKEREKKS
jgi:hypothetical protein